MTLLAILLAVVAGALITTVVARSAYSAGHEAATGRVVASLRTLRETCEHLDTPAQLAAIEATAEQLEDC